MHLSKYMSSFNPTTESKSFNNVQTARDPIKNNNTFTGSTPDIDCSVISSSDSHISSSLSPNDPSGEITPLKLNSSPITQPFKLGDGKSDNIIGHLNVNRLITKKENKLDEMREVLFQPENNISIVGFTETFLHRLILDDLHVDNYVTERKDRLGQEGGGILFYVKDTIKYERLFEFEMHEVECIWLIVSPKFSKSFILCLIYRPPHSNVKWYEKFEQMLYNISSKYASAPFYIFGDFNIDFNSPVPKHWQTIISSYSLTQMITEPTRITDSTATILDHLYTNVPNNIKEIKIPPYSLSDHSPVIFSVKNIQNCKTLRNRHTLIQYRQFKNFKDPDFFLI
ncbi:hypothetical protein SNE40_009772 [Patella caerulea]|uniref:Endonuclease/exonuclease/phosphatase domain-containing protein n=1 Tax=Patella caerulea TaxID=87958 RepID=A0AAN8JZA9_PATCE